MITKNAAEAFPEAELPALESHYNRINAWGNVFKGSPSWNKVKRSGLYKRGDRQMNQLNTAKVLCDSFSDLCFTEQVDVTCSDKSCQDYLLGVLQRESFWKTIPHFLSGAFASGGCAVRAYIADGQVKLSYINAADFLPTKWDNSGISDCIFQSFTVKGDNFYTLLERHTYDGENVTVQSRLFRSSTKYAVGERVPLSELYPDVPEEVIYGSKFPVFHYFRPDISNNFENYTPLGVSVFANSLDTLKALDVAFDSFAREFVLGKKRIIVPSSCVQTVVDMETGNTTRYFDADDEAYVALKCDENEDLKITDNTVELRVDEHVKAINALLNILCFQVGLSPGSFSFDANEGIKTATEVISQERKTARTIKCQQNLLVEFIEGICRTILSLGAQLGDIPEKCELTVAFRDGIVVDDNTLIENNINLVSAGLRSKLSAIMEISKCDEATAKKELERISGEMQGYDDGVTE